MARRTKEEIIRDLELKIQKLKEQAVVQKEVKLTKSSAGVAEAISAIENVAGKNNISVAEVIKAIAKFKRTGLKIENSSRK